MNNERPVLSTKNKYYISRHRYYELKHFCLQYREWSKEHQRLMSTLYSPHFADEWSTKLTYEVSDRTSELAIKLEELERNMELIEKAAMKADIILWEYLFKAVTEGLSYTTLSAKYNIPCGKDMYYDRYRAFFKILSDIR